jgi:hypothetical protein
MNDDVNLDINFTKRKKMEHPLCAISINYIKRVYQQWDRYMRVVLCMDTECLFTYSLPRWKQKCEL